MNAPARIAILCAVLAFVAGCSTMGGRPSPRMLDGIEADLRTHVSVLASDEYGGRRPGSEGERLTLRYLADAWEKAGLVSATNDPANPWLAPIELAVRKPDTSIVSFVTNQGKAIPVADSDLHIFTTGRRAIIADAPLMFVGRQSREIPRADLSGTVAVMVWDHEEREEQRAQLLDHGAAAVIAIVLEPVEFSRLVRFRTAGTYGLADDEAGTNVDGYLSLAGANALFGEGRVEQLLRQAEDPGFEPLLFAIKASIEATSQSGALRTHNLIARLPGTDSSAGAVLVMAHWDHFGLCGDPASGDAICNGAVDNASGLAVMTEVAKRLSRGKKLDRDVYFLATTAEEWGLLGATAFARNPPLPLESIVAAFNIDSIGIAPRGSHVSVVGRGMTGLDPDIARVLASARRQLATGNYADRFVRRQDGWALLQRDVPTVMVSSAFADEAAHRAYDQRRYHRASDNPESVEWGGAAEDMLLHVRLVEHFASKAHYPAKPD